MPRRYRFLSGPLHLARDPTYPRSRVSGRGEELLSPPPSSSASRDLCYTGDGGAASRRVGARVRQGHLPFFVFCFAQAK